MELKKIVENIDIVEIKGANNPQIKGVASDSRKVKDGFVFIAVKGVQLDGHEYVNSALSLGAKVIIFEKQLDEFVDGITYVQVKDSADALGKVVNNWFGNPSTKLKLVGVTGTNGKTTTATVLYDLFRCLGYKVGLLSTVANYVDGQIYHAEQTTPDPLTMSKLLQKMVEAGCQYAFMEVSSHAIHQKRISGLQFAGGVFTNLTQDHLDYHKTMAEYLKAKKLFFDNLPKTAFALTNIDDKNGVIMLQNTIAQKHTYSVRTLADFKARIIEKHFDGTSIEINNKEVAVQFVGVFNVYNLLAVYGVAVLLGQKEENILVALSTLKPVSGRFETIRSANQVTAIVDYAHTPDALINVLEAIHGVLDGNGRVITVVGCGGNRDKTKRPIMASEAAKLSDQLIITSDNPRFEEPNTIIADMVAGLDAAQKKKTICIEQREQAIKTACALAVAGDVILIAGKGHEDYQDVKGEKHHFDDREIVREIFK